jgi:uncharacterized protein (DUF697 family)
MGTDLIVLPTSRQQLAGAAKRSRQLVQRRALVSAGASLVPVPGLDIAADISVLMSLITRINQEFGLSPRQIERLDINTKTTLYRILVEFGGAMIGKTITRDVAMRALSLVGTRVTAARASRYVPVAGQALSAALSYTAMRYVGERHIKDCIRIVEGMIEITG